MDDRHELLLLLARLEVVRAEAMRRLVQASAEDRLLTVHEAAPILSVTVDWLYRHANAFSFTVRLGPGHVRFSNAGIQDYLRRKRR